MPAVLLLACALPLAVPADPPAGRKFAVLVGVNRFDHRQLPPLDFAVNDAAEMARMLGGLGYQVTLLTDATPTKPTKANIDAALKAVLRQARRADTVLIGLSAHGLQFGADKQTGAFLCPSDAVPRPDRTDTLIPVSDLYRELDDSAAGVRVLLVDACRNDPAAPPAGRKRSAAAGLAAAVPPQGVAALFSCGVGQESLEHPDLKHGVFFHHVIEGLKGGAAGADGEVTFYSLAEFVSRRVGKTAARLSPGHVQTPNQRADLQGEPPVLATVKAGSVAPPARVGAAPAVPRAGWTDLLAGGDSLDGWQARGDGKWAVTGGVLSAVRGGGSLNTVAEYTDYELELEFRLARGANSGVFLRGTAHVEVQLCDNANRPQERYKTGAIWGKVHPSPPPQIAAGQWHALGVTVRGDRVTVRVDGVRRVDDAVMWPAPKGPIGLQTMGGGIDFRAVRVKPLDP